MIRSKSIVDIIQTALIIGLIVFWVIQARSSSFTPPSQPASISESSVSQPTRFPETNILSLQASVSGLISRLEKLELTGSGNSSAAIFPSPSTAFQPQLIYLGSASTIQRDWTNSEVEVKLNSADYPADVTAVFEAQLSIVGGEAWARLTNKTTGAVMSITEIFHNTNTLTWKSSPGFKLHSGNYTYVVQLRSTSGETANLSGARLKLSR